MTITSLQDDLERARTHHRAGKHALAEQGYRQVLRRQPHNLDALCLLSETCQAQGKLADAEEALLTALNLSPGSAQPRLRLAELFKVQGKRSQAIAQLKEVLQLDPMRAEVHTQVGILLAEEGDTASAVGHFREAIRLRPDAAPPRHNLGIALAQLGHREEAAEAMRQALALQPNYAEAHHNLGLLLVQLGKPQDAVDHCRHAIAARPDYIEAYNNLGSLLNSLNRHAEAAVYLQQAIRLRPRFAEAHNNLGLALTELGRYKSVESCFHNALREQPANADAHCNLGSLYAEQGRMEEALASHQIACWHQPANVSVRWNRAMALLKAGRFAEGWQEYECRWQHKETPPRSFVQPRWPGGSLAGKTILVHSEQGMGDTIQFIRYAAVLRDLGGRVIVQCPWFFIPLFTTCPGVSHVVAEGDQLPPFDVWSPLLSLPGLVGTTLANIPAGVPYLHAQSTLQDEWRQRLAGRQGLKVGIAWQGNPHHRWDRHRSFPLAHYAPLAAVDGVHLVSVQRGPGSEQIHALRDQFSVLDVGAGLEATTEAFDRTAALLTTLDLVITPDTATAHLAGALGVPVWVALAAKADWRWLTERDDSPWYPTMRLYRQAKLGRWVEVFERMAEELRIIRDKRNEPQGLAACGSAGRVRQ